MLNDWKQSLKQKMTDAQLERWRKLRRFGEQLAPELLVARGLSRVGARRTVRLKEHLNLKGRLDYPGADIWLTLDSSMSMVRLSGCTKEPDTVQWLERCFKPGDVLYDIGANVGAYSFVANAITGGRCKVYAFEPSFNTFAALSQNVILNGCAESVFPLHVALADTTGLIDFHYGSLAPGASMHVGLEASLDTSAVHAGRYKLPTLCYRLDDFVKQFSLDAPNHIKVDVDGPELAVLRGAEGCLVNQRLRSVLVEVDENRYPGEEIQNLVERHGFRCVEKYPRITPKMFNYIFER